MIVGVLGAVAMRPDGLCFAKIRCDFDFTLVTHKKLNPTPTVTNYFTPLLQGTTVSHARLGAIFLGDVNWFQTIKTNHDHIQALRNHISTNIILGVMAQ